MKMKSSLLITAAFLASVSTCAYAVDFHGAPYAHVPRDPSSPSGIGSDYVAKQPADLTASDLEPLEGAPLAVFKPTRDNWSIAPFGSKHDRAADAATHASIYPFWETRESDVFADLATVPLPRPRPKSADIASPVDEAGFIATVCWKTPAEGPCPELLDESLLVETMMQPRPAVR
jgi:hypothetical protein